MPRGSAAFEALLRSDSLPVVTAGSFDRYWTERGTLLRDELQKVDGLAARHELPAADFVDGVLKVTPLTSGVPEEAEAVAPRQNYRPASGSGSLDEVHRRLYPFEEGGASQRSRLVTHRHFGRCHQSRAQ